METPSPRANDEPVYVISVAARLVGLPGWVLRVLDQEGIVVPSRTDSNRRLYSDKDIVLLNRVRHLTEERGVNIAGVKVILEMEREQAESGTPSSSSDTALSASPIALTPRSPLALLPHLDANQQDI
jgi:MerR family transcriptional regulator/heat shock protein HspR